VKEAIYLSRVIMLVDLDYFFAQAEEIRNPTIKEKPIVVCVYSGRGQDSGAVSTANYIARKYGVKSGIPIFQAKKKLENVNAVFLAVDYAFYEEMSGKVMNVLRSNADIFEQVSIDEAYLDVSQKTGEDFEKAKELAQQIKEELKAQLKLTSSIGIGPNKLIAKIAADNQKPDGLTITKPEQVETFLYPLSVNRLIGVGAKTEEKMHALEVSTIGDLARYDVQRLIAVFGKALGTYFHNASLGIDDSPVQEKDKVESFSRISTLKQDTRDLNLILEKTDQLCKEIQATVIEQRLIFRTVGISTVMTDMSIHTRSKTLENPTNDPEIMKKVVRELFEKLLGETELEARRVGVRVSNFAKELKSQKQLTSFFDSAQN
jgi:DNA polymerase IV (archaeal DinB-like DNA polymerase)